MSDTDLKIINHDLRVVNGKTIQMPTWSAANADKEWGSLQIPDPYEAAHATQKYPVGTVFRDDGRTFVYGLYSATTTVKTMGYPICTVATMKDLANAGIAGSTGGYTIQLNYGAACAVNKYAGGYLGMKGSQYRSFRIISNTVQDADNYVTFTIDSPLVADIAAGDDFVLMEDPYREMRWYITADSRPYIGITCSTVVASYYAWIQTWGVCMMTSTFNSFEGGDGNQFGLFMYHGSLQALPDNTSGAVHGSIIQVGGAPLAGYLACGSDPSSPADVSIAAPVYLMIRP